ncbi:MAG: hypothetical protein B7Z14_09335, partial [Bosea sp. 32-68-6]
IVDADTSPMFEAVKLTLAKPMVQWTLGAAHGDQRDLAKALHQYSPERPLFILDSSCVRVALRLLRLF